LAQLSRASVRRTRRPHIGAYLVDVGRVERFRSQVHELGDDLVCTGPWPPYTFCGS
jgi:hypothetical protein